LDDVAGKSFKYDFTSTFVQNPDFLFSGWLLMAMIDGPPDMFVLFFAGFCA